MHILFICSQLPTHVLASFDVSNAFLNAELSEDVVITTQPAPELLQFGLVKPGTLYQRTGARYGRREAPKLWEEARDKTLKSFLFQIDSDGTVLDKVHIIPVFGLLFGHRVFYVQELFGYQMTGT